MASLHDPGPPGDRAHCLLVHSASNSSVLNPTQEDTLAPQPQPGNSGPGVQGEQQPGESEAQEEIAPGDIKYRLEPLAKAPLQTQPPSSCSRFHKPQGSPFRTAYGFESGKPWKAEPTPSRGEQPSRPGDHSMTTAHQVSVHSQPLGQSVLPVHIQGQKVAPAARPGHGENVSLHQSDLQAPRWRQIVAPDPDKSTRGIEPREQLPSCRAAVREGAREQPCLLRLSKYIQYARRNMACGWQPTAHLYQEPRPPRLETAMLGGSNTARLAVDPVTRVSPLPPPRHLVKTLKGKWPSHILGVFKAKFQTETTSKPFSQDWGAQPQVRCGPRDRGHENPPAPAEVGATTRTAYLPLFSERVKLCKPKINSDKLEPGDLSPEHRPVQLPEIRFPKYLCLENRRAGERAFPNILRRSAQFRTHIS
ncbi:uncharacterized protein [Oryctolagus cuniculus]|uniref:Uncharacterized protein n=2 Tax=Oryctolagus cuniculus TaxID=9986 RepID=A0A5F9C3L9_RABIT|nr:uncharacterized protein LOC103349280 isoform X2 [Oryctolagus cuniculus]